MPRMFAIVSAVVLIVVLVATFGFASGWFGRGGDQFAQCREGAIAGDIGGPFTLVDAEGETVTDEDVITMPSVVYFGYTYCPDVCPLDMSRNTEAVLLLEENEGIEAQPVFITIDPERDTPQVVGDFASNFHERAIGLTGSPEQISAASQTYRTYYRKQEDGDPDYYLMDHSAFSYIVLPEAGFVDYVGRDETPEGLEERLACFARAAG